MADIHDRWDTLLQKHVVVINNGHASVVDYDDMKKDSAELKLYLDEVSALPLQTYNSWSSEQKLAFLINAYNAHTVSIIITYYPELKSVQDLGEVFSSPWTEETIPLLGETTSLENLAKRTVLKDGEFAELRSYFALNNGSIGAPLLRNEAYVGEQLDDQLEAQTNAFLSDRSRNYAENNTLFLSEYFNWNNEEFSNEFFLEYTGALGLNEKQIGSLSANKMRKRYLKYDWLLNGSE